MPSYENEKCPVCGKAFEKEDNIVTCPSCGTPHHSECYKQIGHCINKDKHGSFDYQRDAASDANQNNNTANVGDFYYQNDNAQRSDRQKMSGFGVVIDEIPKDKYSEYDNIDGVSLNDIACVVKVKAESFIEKFKKRFSFNFAALIFGPYYLFYRKMVKEGALFLAIRMIISLVAQGIYAKEYSALGNFLNENIASLRNGDTEIINQFLALYEKAMPMMLIVVIGSLAVNIIIAFTANTLYKKRVLGIIKRVDEKLEGGSEFAQTSLLMGNEPQLSQEQMRKLYLSRFGGTSLLTPVTAFLILDLVSRFVSQL